MSDAANRYVCVCAFLSALLVAGCDPLTFLESADDTRRAEEEALVRKCPEVTIVDVTRADVLKVLLDGKTQNVHLAGICVPSAKRRSYNIKLARAFQLNRALMEKYGRQAIAVVHDVTKDRQLRLVELSTRTNRNGNVIVEGDILFPDRSTLSEKLLEYGVAVALEDVPQNRISYRRIEEEARATERGVWRHPVPLPRRFSVSSSFKSRTLTVDRKQVYTEGPGPRHLLESHKEFEKQADVTLEIRVRRPFFHAYKGKLMCRFYLRDELGKRQQEISVAPRLGKLRDPDGRGGRRRNDRKPLSRAEQNIMRDEARSVRDYNRAVSGQDIFSVSAGPSMTESFELVSPSTNLILFSDIVDYTESTKAGTPYSHGQYHVGYDLEVWIDTNLVYSHYHSR